MERLRVLMILAAFFMSFFVFTGVCFSQVAVLEVNNRGDFRIHENDWRISTIRAEVEALPYLNSFKKAIANQGEVVTVWRDEKEVGFKFMFKKILNVKEVRILYDKDEGLIKCREFIFQEKKNSFTPMLFYGSFLLMILSNISYYKNKERKAIISSALSIAALGSAFFSVFLIVSFYIGGVFVFQFENIGTFLFYSALMATQLVPGCICFFSSDRYNKQNLEIYKFSSLAYYCFTALAFSFIFIF